MLKRNFAVLLVAGLVVGGAAVAMAGDDPPRPSLLAAAQSEETPSSTAPAGEAPEDLRARRQALRTCLEQAGEDREARQACLEAAGPGVLHHRRGPGHPGRHGAGIGMPLLGRAVHGTVVVPDGDGGWQEVTFDRGEVDEATDGSKIVLDRPDGETVTIELTGDTRYHGIADAAAVVEGRPAVVVSRDGKALHVLQKDPDRRHRPGNNGAAPDVPTD